MMLARTWWGGAFALLQACAPAPGAVAPKNDAPPPKIAHVAPLASASPSASPTPPPAPPPTLQSLLCGARDRCTLTGPVGAPLAVGDATHVVERLVVLAPSKEKPAAEGSSEDDDVLLPCDAEEFWFVARDAGGAVRDYQLLTGGCTGEEADERWCGRAPRAEVKVEGERVAVSWFTPQFQCMGAFRAMGDPVYSLATFALLERHDYSYHSMAGYSTASDFSFVTRLGSESFSYLPYEPEPGSCPKVDAKPNLTIPIYELDADFEKVGWTTMDFAGCAGQLTPDALAHAVWMHGTTSEERETRPRVRPTGEPATLLAMASSSAVYLELRPAEAPGARATIEVCGSGELYYDSGYCEFPPEPASCTTFDLAGAVKKGSAHVEKAGELMRYRVTAAGIEGSLSLRYRDGARGIDLRTSTRLPGQRFAMGSFALAYETKVECRTTEGRLELVQQRPAERNHPLTLD